MSTERVDCIKGSKTKAQDPSDNPVAAKREKVFVDTLLDLIASGGMAREIEAWLTPDTKQVQRTRRATTIPALPFPTADTSTGTVSSER
jgi:hypothetical protein